MTKPTRRRSEKQASPPDPVDVTGGIPDRSQRAAKWKYAALLIVFLAWVAFLLFYQLAADPPP